MVKTTTSQSAVEAKPTIMKAVHAAHIVDKNSRTIAKILQLLDVTQRPSAAKIDPEGHTARRVEKLKNRLNRRLQKLARWGDKPVDDRQPAELRVSLRSNNQTQFKSSFAGISNIPVAPPVPFASSSSAAYQRIAYVPPIAPTGTAAVVAPVVPVVVAATVAAPAAVTAVTAPSSSSSLPAKAIVWTQSEKAETPSVAIDTKPTAVHTLPAFSSLHDQSQVFGMNVASGSSVGVSSGPVEPASSSTKSMMGSMGGMGGMSMGGVAGGKMDIDAIRAMQMQSVKELSLALKGDEPISSPASSSSSSSSSSVPVVPPEEVSPVAVTAMDVVDAAEQPEEEPVISIPIASVPDTVAE